MTRWSIALGVVGIIYGLSWFLPVDIPMPGWGAFLLAIGPLFGEETFHPDRWWETALWIASGLSNVLFVLIFLVVAIVRERVPAFASWVLLVAGVLNLHWPVTLTESLAKAVGSFFAIGIGYHMWVLAFFGLAGIVHFRARADSSHNASNA